MKLHEDATLYALFLDFDGTLVEIAPGPADVVVPGDLAMMLATVTERLNGALAILTGRPIADIDGFLTPLQPVAAGVHGAEVRQASAGTIEPRSFPIAAPVVGAVRAIAGSVAGAIVELKSASIAVHYRQVPAAEPVIEAALARLVADSADHLILCRGRKVLEIVPAHVSKGAALETLMRLPAFRGRRPIMIGDDLSDLTAFDAAIRLGGMGLKVAGEQFSPSDAVFANPAAVRTWLAANFGRLD